MKKYILLVILSLVFLFSIGALFQSSGRYQISGNLSGSNIPFILDTKTGRVWKWFADFDKKDKDSPEMGFSPMPFMIGKDDWSLTPE
ncbi:hypothetical protein ACFLZ2_05495 [Candidatus Margulisiibacteriota bacterium]